MTFFIHVCIHAIYKKTLKPSIHAGFKAFFNSGPGTKRIQHYATLKDISSFFQGFMSFFTSAKNIQNHT